MTTDTYRPLSRKSDIFLLLLLLCAVITLPLVIQRTQWVPQANRLVGVTLWAVLVGVLLAWSVLPDWLSWLVGTILGLEFSVQFATRVLPRAEIVLADLGRAMNWLWRLVVYQSLGSELPFANSVKYAITQTALTRDNVTKWIADVQVGQASSDNTVLWLGVSLCVWLLTWNAAYEIFRHRRTFVALLPLGVGVVANVSFTDIGMGYVQFYMAITVLTLVWTNMRRLETIWARLGLDFSSEVRRDSLFAGSMLATVVVVVALLTPYITYTDAVWYFWDRVGPRLEAFYKDLDKAFAGRNPVPSPTPGRGGIGISGHTVGSVPSTTGRMLFSVKTSDPAPLPDDELALLEQAGLEAIYLMGPKHYWRERTYDVYTGHGWDSSQRNSKRFTKDQTWREVEYPHTVLTQTYTIRDRSQQLALAVNEPVQFDRDYTVLVRGEDDFVGLVILGNTYSVHSRLPDVAIADLKQAEGEYPDWVQGRYLSLPKIPDRVRRTAEETIRSASATTRYDKAVALEAYVRGFKYDLTVEPPPLDSDVVEYYLFEAQRGYCDYSATAMTVMLRAVGVAARYASGYAMGEYDGDEGAWVVTEDDAHAWVEVYFPGYGWVEFEPTPSQATFVRPATRGDLAGLSALPATQQQRARISPFWLAAGGLALLVAFIIVWPPRWFRRPLPPRQRVWRVYNQLVRRARWIGVIPYGGQTPSEYLDGLSSEVNRRVDYGPVSSRDIGLIGGAYQRARYSPEEITVQDSDRAEGAWRRLRGLLIRLAFGRPMQQR